MQPAFRVKKSGVKIQGLVPDRKIVIVFLLCSQMYACMSVHKVISYE